MASPQSEPLVIVVAYHGVGTLRRALCALDGADVLVIDNSADPGARAAAEEAGATYLDSGGNIGFARAVNIGIRRAGIRDVVLVNPDAEVSAATVQALVARMYAAGPKVAAAAPRLIWPDGRAQRVRWPFPSPCGAWIQAAGLGRLQSDGQGFLVGSVLALRAAALERLGGFDETFFLYGEETDWERRAVADGWSLMLAEDQVATHVGGGSSDQEWRREVHFHAGGERYVRKWFGASGWASHRLATSLGSAARVLLLRGDRRAQAARRLALYLRGPMRRERRILPGQSRHVVHVVVTDSFAGTERYVATVANGLFRRGWTVTVIGGNFEMMRRALDPGVKHHPAKRRGSAVRRLAACRQVDVLHTHLTDAELAGMAVLPLLRAPVVATRHIAARRGSSAVGRMVAPLIRGALAAQLAPSNFVADAVGEDCRIVPSGVRDRDRADIPRERMVLALQRLEPEKATDVAVAAFASSGLAKRGWRLVIAGRGSLESSLRQQSRDAGIGDAVDLVGFIPDPSDLLDRASVFLAAGPDEAFGLSVAEAMSVGLPVVAAGAGAYLELLGTRAWTFPPAGAGQAGELLRLVADRPDLASSYGAALQRRQRELFGLDHHLDGLEQVYREVLSRP